MSLADSSTQTRSPHIVGMLAAGPFGLVAFIIAFVLGRGFASDLSWNTMDVRVLVISAIVAPAAYVWGVRKASTEAPVRFGMPLLSSTVALLVGVVEFATIIVPVLSSAFQEYIFIPFWGAVFVAIFTFLLAYVAAVWGARQWAGDILLLAIAIVGAGILVSAIESGAAKWWTAAISSLGTAASKSWGIFAVSCMVAGFMMLLIVPSLGPVVRRASEAGFVSAAGAKWFPRLMAALAVLLFLVGAFPMDGNKVDFAIHNTAGVGFGVILVAAMALTRRAFPGMPKEFFWYSWVFAGLSIIAAPLYEPLGIFSLAELEVVAFGLGGLWAILLFATMKDAGFDSDALSESSP